MAINRTLTATIAQGEPSATVSLAAGPDKSQPLTLVGLITPQAFDGDSIAFSASLDNVTYHPINRDDTEVTLSINGSTAYALDPITFAPWKFVRILTQTSGTNTNQAAETEFTLIAREVS